MPYCPIDELPEHPPRHSGIYNGKPMLPSTPDDGYWCPLCWFSGKYTWVEYANDMCPVHDVINRDKHKPAIKSIMEVK
jgi:hypothetical protein